MKSNFAILKSFANSSINSKDGVETGVETLDELQRALNDSNAMQELSVQTGLQPILLFGIAVIVSVVVLIACLSIQALGLFVSRVIGFVYPAYASFKALESLDTLDDTQWLTYWLTFAIISMGEDVLLRTDGPIPLYLTAKVCFLLWCQLMNGSAFLYTLVVRPTALKVTTFLEDAVRDGLQSQKVEAAW
jgi:receptor expression-enhancing protein 5/6